MSECVIRPAIPEDAADIATVHVASWRETFRGILPEAYLDSLHADQRLRGWERALSPGSPISVIVAELDNDIVGFASVGPSENGVEGETTLYTLYLHPDVIRQGIGRALLAEAERVMADMGAAMASLRAITANPRARHVYERAGWHGDPDSMRMEDAWGIQVETIRYRKRLEP